MMNHITCKALAHTIIVSRMVAPDFFGDLKPLEHPFEAEEIEDMKLSLKELCPNEWPKHVFDIGLWHLGEVDKVNDRQNIDQLRDVAAIVRDIIGDAAFKQSMIALAERYATISAKYDGQEGYDRTMQARLERAREVWPDLFGESERTATVPTDDNIRKLLGI